MDGGAWRAAVREVTEPDTTERFSETSQPVQWLRLHASNAGDVDLFTGQGTEIPHVVQQK